MTNAERDTMSKASEVIESLNATIARIETQRRDDAYLAKRTQGLVDTQAATIASQRETLLSDAQWIESAASKLRNQDNVLASQAATIVELQRDLAGMTSTCERLRATIDNIRSK